MITSNVKKMWRYELVTLAMAYKVQAACGLINATIIQDDSPHDLRELHAQVMIILAIHQASERYHELSYVPKARLS
jgi:hypothetical protein